MTNPANHDETPHDVGVPAIMHGRQILADAAAAPAGGDPAAWLQRVREAAQQLFQVIERHQVDVEDEDGLLGRVTGHKPGLMSGRQRLEHEHTDMLYRLSEIEEEVERQVAADDFNLDLVRLQAQVVRDALLLHLTRTDSLVFDAYYRVEGGEGG